MTVTVTLDGKPFTGNVSIALTSPAPATPALPGAGGPTVSVGPTRALKTIKAALATFTPLGGTILLDGGTYTEASDIEVPTTIRAAGKVVFNWTGQPLVWDQAGFINRADFLLDGATFGIEMFGAMAQDSAATAVRPYLGTRTTLRNVIIHDCADGVLTNPSIESLSIFDSEIYHCSGDDQSHGIYVATAGKLVHLERVNVHDLLNPGNFVKSRALRTELVGCNLGGPTSVYGSKLVDACEGGTVVISGGVWEKPAGADDSHVLFGYAAENTNAGHSGATITGVTLKANCELPIVINFDPATTVAFSACTVNGNIVKATGSKGPVTGLPI
jgi:hypothetical protein